MRFITVVPRTTSIEKITAIKFYGGEIYFIDNPKSVYKTAKDLADQLNGYYIDQFTYAERATDWRGNNNIANSIFSQLKREKHPIPTWIIASTNTDGTSATLDRYIRYDKYPKKLCVADPQESVFHKHYMDRSIQEGDGCTFIVKGIGRAKVETSFLPDIIDPMIAAPDEASLASMYVISQLIGRSCGG